MKYEVLIIFILSLTIFVLHCQTKAGFPAHNHIFTPGHTNRFSFPLSPHLYQAPDMNFTFLPCTRRPEPETSLDVFNRLPDWYLVWDLRNLSCPFRTLPRTMHSDALATFQYLLQPDQEKTYLFVALQHELFHEFF